MKKNLTFPDINLAFDGAKSLEDVCNNYIKILNDTGNILNTLYANKLLEYNEVETRIPILGDEFHEFKRHIREWACMNNVHIRIKRRKKNFIGFNEKIRLYLNSNRDLDEIHDLLGLRLILETSPVDTEESVNLCYQLLNEAIRFFAINRHCLFLKAEPRIDSTNCTRTDILVPSSGIILKGFEKTVKDYIRYPKNNGYQSLHCCIKTPNGLIFEIQIRTYAMDNHAEFGSGLHSVYKRQRYEGAEIFLDPNKIQIPGISFDTNGDVVSDISGLLKGYDPFNTV